MAGEQGDARVIDLDRLRLTGSELHRMRVRNLKIPFGGKVKLEEGEARGAWRHPRSYSPAVSIEAEANSNPVETNGERKPEQVCTGKSRGRY